MSVIDILSGGQLDNLPTPVKIAGGLVGAGVILGVSYFVFHGDLTALAIVALGIVLIVGLLWLYHAILKHMNKRKANPLSMGLAGNAAAAPQAVSEPARRARLDDLRRNFEQGVEKFRAAGKNLYSVPWYVLVGEPGSGKTEAIRHCNVGFPPGLQNQLQGAGGTLNMNWWFTNQAIILDTAGRLMFEEIVPGSTNEWAEFLNLLKHNRPNCPINGMLLVIPVDTLIKDAADQIEKKAGKIAQQFDQIQRTLGVRFPVFVIITKCDLLNGFREFFDNLNDPQLQHQILGWSNPAALDERFDPAAIVNHLESVKARLIERRHSLLLDPVNTEDAQSRRVDQVDALYAMPDSLAKIAPRLRRYLEMIFVAGEWSPKPLFLRGIYFTSSMTEGSALDAELAEVLGVPVDSLPEGRVWRRDRAYFLRDLFIEKVFRERGLVTRASNADKQQRTRRAVVLAVGFIAVIVLFAVTWLGAKSLEKNIGGQRDFWIAASEFDPKQLQLVKAQGNPPTSFKYYDPFMGEGLQKHEVTAAQLFAQNLPLVQANIDIPAIFKPMALLSGNINTERPKAYRDLFESTVLAPAFTAARAKMNSAGAWTPQQTAALVQLMKLEYTNAVGKAPAADDKHPQVELDPLFAAVLSDDDYKKFKPDAQGLQSVADWVYTAPAGGDKSWPPALLAAGKTASVDAVNQGLNSAIAYWTSQTNSDSDAFKNIKDVRAALTDFQAAEKALRNRQAAAGKIEKFAEYADFQKDWNTQIEKLNAARARIAAAWALASKSKGDTASLADLYKSQKDAGNSAALAAYDNLLRYTADPPANPDAALTPAYAALVAARAKLQAAEKTVKDWQSAPEAAATMKEFASWDANYLAPIKINDTTLHRYEVPAQLYDAAGQMLVAENAATTQPISPTASLEDALAKIDKDYADAAEKIKRTQSSATDGPDGTLAKAAALSQFLLDASDRAKKDLLLQSLLASPPKNSADWSAAVAALAKSVPRDNLQRPKVPLVTFPEGQEKTFDDQFSPDAAGIIFDRLALIAKITAGPDASTHILDAAALLDSATTEQKTFSDYRDQYITYWRDGVKDQLVFSDQHFPDFANKLGDSSSAGIAEQLKAYSDRMAYALNRLGDSDDASAIKQAPLVSSDEAKEALSNWLNLGNDPHQVRRAILALTANDFHENYTVLTAKSTDSCAGVYWQRFPVALLRALAGDSRAEIETGLADLAKYQRFPLAPPGDPKDDLSLDDLLAARAALDKIRGIGAAPPPNPAAPALAQGAKPIGLGGHTNVRDIDAQLDLLRGVNLFKDKQPYFDQLDQFFAALPADKKSLSVTLTVAKDKLKNLDSAISNRFVYMLISQKDPAGKDHPLKNSTLSSIDTLDFCTVDYPAGDLTLQFSDVPNGPVKNTTVIPGNWGVLRLLHDAKSATRDGNKWTLEYPITTDDKKTYSLFFTLEFKQPVPDLKDWPTP